MSKRLVDSASSCPPSDCHKVPLTFFPPLPPFQLSLLQRKVDDLQAQNKKLELARQNTVSCYATTVALHDARLQFNAGALCFVCRWNLYRLWRRRETR